jgi:clan AA aspartic protease (TIGR02281 family)
VRDKIGGSTSFDTYQFEMGKGSGEMAARLGNVIYWLSLAIAIPFGFVAAIQAFNWYVTENNDWARTTALQFAAVSLGSWLVGRPVRYVLSGPTEQDERRAKAYNDLIKLNRQQIDALVDETLQQRSSGAGPEIQQQSGSGAGLEIQRRNSGAGLEIQMVRKAGTYVVPVRINNAITLDFLLDSGAADVSIPSDVFSTLMRTGTITKDDILGKQAYQLADGSVKNSFTFRMRSLQVGSFTLENVECSVAEAAGPLLLGMSLLRRFSSWSVDNDRHVLILCQDDGLRRA